MNNALKSITKLDPANYLYNAEMWLEVAITNENSPDPMRFVKGYKAALLLDTFATLITRETEFVSVRDSEV